MYIDNPARRACSSIGPLRDGIEALTGMRLQTCVFAQTLKRVAAAFARAFGIRSLRDVTVLLLYALSCASAIADECPPEAPRHSPNPITGETCPDIGSMGATKLAIPKNYILGPDFVYGDTDIWNAQSFKARPKQSFSEQIRYFSIRVRLTTLAPIESSVDAEEFEKSMRMIWTLAPPNNQWIFVQFSYPSIFAKKFQPVDLHREVDNIIGDVQNSKWSYVAEGSKKVGLEQYVSPKMPSDTTPEEINELFFDRFLNETLITCSNIVRKVAPFDELFSCRHKFFLQNNEVEVVVDNIRDKNFYLQNWKVVENRIKSLFDIFVVK